MEMPAWLPAMLDTSYGTDKEWDRLIARLYEIFERDFIRIQCHFEELRVVFDNRKIGSPYEEGFWHLVSRDDKRINDRLFDPQRARRLPWCKPTIENSRLKDVCVWNFLEKNKRTNTYIWLVDLDYLVILQRRKNVVFLVTAFWVDGDASRKALRKKYGKRII